jgi:hypothetical protein
MIKLRHFRFAPLGIEALLAMALAAYVVLAITFRVYSRRATRRGQTDGEPGLAAHAWLAARPIIVTGSEERNRYRKVATL